MPYRSVEEIEMELNQVNEIINSKKEALQEYPSDFGFEIEFMEFENIQEDLIRELSKAKSEPKIYTQHIKKRLNKTQILLLEKRDEYILNPDNEELENDIEILELMVKGLGTELQRCYLNQNFSVFELRIKGKKIVDFIIPIQQLGEILLKFQEIPSSIAEAIFFSPKKYLIEHERKNDFQISLNKNIVESKKEKIYDKKSEIKENLSKVLHFNSQLDAVGIMGGSVRIILTSNQAVFDNETLNDTFKIFKELIECGDNKEALQKETDKIGAIEPIIKYRNFLKSLYDYDLDVELSGKNRKLEDIEIFDLNHKKAKKIYNVLNKRDEPLSHSIIKLGTLKAVDLEARTFKFHLDDEDKTIFGRFNEELDSIMKNKTFNETYKIELSELIPSTNLKKQTTKYRLSNFLD